MVFNPCASNENFPGGLESLAELQRTSSSSFQVSSLEAAERDDLLLA